MRGLNPTTIVSLGLVFSLACTDGLPILPPGSADARDGGQTYSDVTLEPSDYDLDGDGIPNDIEDRNLNGEYDEGTRETDLNNPDTDRDGLTDGQEDTNRNGEVDEGETDPRLVDSDGDGIEDGEETLNTGTDPANPDSDGDGISDGAELNVTNTDPLNPDSDNDGLKDGEEDRNGDGVLDANETDPNDVDTDADGIRDANEPVQIACALSRQPETTFLEDADADIALLLPEYLDGSGMFLISGSNAEPLRGGYFERVGGNIYGFFMVKNLSEGNISGLAQIEDETDFLNGVGAVTDRQINPNLTWDGLPAASARLNLTTDREVDTAGIRDEVAAAVARRPASELGARSATPTASGTNWHVRMSATAREDGQVVIIGVVAPITALTDDPLAPLRMAELTDTTIVSHWGDQTEYACEDVIPDTEQSKVDFLWLVDASLSMLDQRRQVAVLSEQFFQTLRNTTLDFRIGVVSTGMHTDDSWILVEPGFSAVREDFVEQMQNPPGGTTEHGLATGLRVIGLARSAATSGGTHIRPDAKVVAIFFSDEQDQGVDLQVRQGVPGCNPDVDPLLADCQVLNQQIEAYQELEVTAFAIVGDTPDGCIAEDRETGGVAEEPGRGYIQLAYATGGGFGSICSADLSEPIDSILRSAFAVASSYRLEPIPITHTIRVVVDSEVVERDPFNGFDYDAAAQKLVFYGTARPEVDSEIIVSYQYWLDQEPDSGPIRPD